MLVGGTNKKELVTTEWDPAAGVQKVEGVRRRYRFHIILHAPARYGWLSGTRGRASRVPAATQSCSTACFASPVLDTNVYPAFMPANHGIATIDR